MNIIKIKMNKNNRQEFLLITKLHEIMNLDGSNLSRKNGFTKVISLKNTKIQKINKNNRFLHQIYQFKNQNSLNLWFKDKIVTQLLQYYFNLEARSWGNIGGIKVITSKPIFKHTNDKVNIVIFIYKYVNPTINPSNNNSFSIWWRLIENIFGDGTNMSLTNIIQNIYHKNVEIEPIVLKYDYMDSSILSRGVSDNVLKYLTFKGKYYQNMQYNINLINTYQYMLTYNKYKENVKTILNDRDMRSQMTDNVLNANMVWSLLLNKYISGCAFSYNGKLVKSDSSARTIHYKKINGTLKSIHTGLNSQTMSNAHNINKNGKNNTKIILNHI